MRSRLVKMRVANIGCIDETGVEIELDSIVCLVGANNCGKSTILRAYQAAVGMEQLRAEDIHSRAINSPGIVELWVHIPEGVDNIDAKWKEPKDDLLLVRSKWAWPTTGGPPTRTTWNPEEGAYAENGKAAGLDTVFNSRLPRPFRIESLEDPTSEHGKLLELVLEPVKRRLVQLAKEEGSDLRTKIREMQQEAEKPVQAFREDLDKIQAKVSASYKTVFSTADVKLHVALGELTPDPSASLLKASRVEIVEPHGGSSWSQQGTGSQRALFWSMLEVRSELNKLADQKRQTDKVLKEAEKALEKLRAKLPTLKQAAFVSKCEDDIRQAEEGIKALGVKALGEGVGDAESFLPGYMLLIDEPETALHPGVIRSAKDHLYSLAEGGGWQVMLATHHPCFVDPVKDHTTIVRLHRASEQAAPNVYRADTAELGVDDKENLKGLLAFDVTLAEMFFGAKVVIVEGDTEYSAFSEVMVRDAVAFPVERRPLLIRARGKATIPTLVRVLTQFKVDFAVLHDIDSPRIRDGSRKNSAYTVNGQIIDAVAAARAKGLSVVHRCSCPNFEIHHGMALPAKDKPLEAWRSVGRDAAVRSRVRATLDALLASPGPNAAAQAEDGAQFETTIRAWSLVNAVGDAAYEFGP